VTSRGLCGIIFRLDLCHESTRRSLREFDRRYAWKNRYWPFFQPCWVPYDSCDAQDSTFPADYFIAQVLTPPHQHKMSLSQMRRDESLLCILIIQDAIPADLSLIKWPHYDASGQCILPIPLT
jgi:hypothetical protein